MKRTAAAITAVFLAAAVWAPSARAGYGGPGILRAIGARVVQQQTQDGQGQGSAQRTGQGDGSAFAQRMSIVQLRVSQRLALRQQVFALVTTRLQRRIDRITFFASKVKAAGYDVASVSSLVAQAQSQLDTAKTKEPDVEALFKNVDAASGAAALAGDIQSTRVAAVSDNQELWQCRGTLIQAVQDLWSIAYPGQTLPAGGAAGGTAGTDSSAAAQ